MQHKFMLSVIFMLKVVCKLCEYGSFVQDEQSQCL
jgi:hypothetical protein